MKKIAIFTLLLSISIFVLASCSFINGLVTSPTGTTTITTEPVVTTTTTTTTGSTNTITEPVVTTTPAGTTTVEPVTTTPGTTTTSTEPVTTTTEPVPTITTTTEPVVTTYNITYNANGHGNKPNDTINATAYPNPLPTMINVDGWTFKGWAESATSKTPVVAGTTINSDKTLYAIWEQVTFTIHFDGISLEDIKNVAYGTTISDLYNDYPALQNPVSKTNPDVMNFEGWYLDSNYSEAINVNTKIIEEKTIYAKFTPIKYTVTFMANEQVVTTEQVTKNGTLTTLPTAPTSATGEFIRWEYNGAAFTTSTKVTGNITVTAVYSSKTITGFGKDYTNWAAFVDQESVSSNTTIGVNKTVGDFTVYGSGNNARIESTNCINTQGAKIEVVLNGSDNKLYFDALWSSSSAGTITVRKVGETETVATYSFAAGVSGDSAKAKLDKSGLESGTYEILTSKACRFYILYKEETTGSVVTKYNVTFVLNNEEDDVVVEVTSGDKVTKPTNPVKTGYEFAGWFTQNTGGSLYDFNTPVTGALSLYARYTKEDSGSISVEKCDGYKEGIVILLNGSDVDYSVYYKLSSASSYTKVDDGLIRVVDTASDTVRCDILGLAKGKYDVKIVDKDGNLADEVITNVEVTENDRSGYAHFGYTTGVGAYNDDGTLKENAIVIYVSEDNKNSVSVTYKNKTYTGIGNILAKLSNFDVPVDVRIFGRISAATWKQLTVSSYSTATTSTVRGANGQYLSLANYDENAIISGGFNELNLDVCSKLNGLTNKIKYDSSKKEFDSYYNMMDISSANNVTIEGVGEGAEIFQWGFTWKSCNSIEVRNLTFTDYTEDACSFEGSGSDSSLTSFAAFTSGRYWLHHNTFNKGKNYWDVCSEQDKHDGDGATDFKRVCYVTLSYNHYYQNHKTGLVGGSDSQMTACLTFHHNFYEQCQSRLPFARQANMHMYNNYYYASTGNNMQIYAAAYAFIENCYFENINKTFTVDNRSYGTAAIKSYNNIYSNCKQTSGATVVTNRTDSVDSGNVFAPNFDTDSTYFYYDSTAQKSDVKLLTPVEEVKTYVPAHAGAEKYCS